MLWYTTDVGGPPDSRPSWPSSGTTTHSPLNVFMKDDSTSSKAILFAAVSSVTRKIAVKFPRNGPNCHRHVCDRKRGGRGRGGRSSWRVGVGVAAAGNASSA